MIRKVSMNDANTWKKRGFYQQQSVSESCPSHSGLGRKDAKTFRRDNQLNACTVGRGITYRYGVLHVRTIQYNRACTQKCGCMYALLSQNFNSFNSFRETVLKFDKIFGNVRSTPYVCVILSDNATLLHKVA